MTKPKSDWQRELKGAFTQRGENDHKADRRNRWKKKKLRKKRP